MPPRSNLFPPGLAVCYNVLRGKLNSSDIARANTAETEKHALGLCSEPGASRRWAVLPGPAQTRNSFGTGLSGLSRCCPGDFSDRVFPLSQCRAGRRPLARWPTRGTQRCLSQALAGWAPGRSGSLAGDLDLRARLGAPPAVHIKDQCSSTFLMGGAKSEIRI